MNNQTTAVPPTRKELLRSLAADAKRAMANCKHSSAGAYWSEAGRRSQEGYSKDYEKVVDRIIGSGVLNEDDVAHLKRSPWTAETVCRLEAAAIIEE